MGNLSLRRAHPWKRGKHHAPSMLRVMRSLIHRVISQFAKCSIRSVSDQRHLIVLTFWEVLIKKTLWEASLPSTLKWGIYKPVGLPTEFKWLSCAPDKSHKEPKLLEWSEQENRILSKNSKIYAIWPGTCRKGPSIKKWDSEPVATSISILLQRANPAMRTWGKVCKGEVIGLEIEKWAAAVSPRSLLFSRVCLF